MGLLANLLSLRAAAPGPLSDFWYQPMGTLASTGVRVDADAALKLSVAWACVDLIASVTGMLPLVTYERKPDGGKQRAYQHPLYDLLHDQPNDWQTASEFRTMLQGHVLLRGNAYCQILPGPRGAVDQLVPLHPDRMQVLQDDDRTLRYLYTNPKGVRVPFLADEIFHLRGLSADGITGLSVIEHARESLGFALAVEQFGNRFFSQGAKPGGILTHPGKVTKDGAKRLRQEWQELHAGLQNAHQVAVLEEGMTFQAIGLAPQDAQMVASREFSVEDVSRWFRVPLHMINSVAKVTSWGTGIEAQAVGFTTFTMLRWFTMWREVIQRDLVLNKQRFFVDFVTDALLKADTLSRYQSYQIGRLAGFLSVNDIRLAENLEPIGDDGNRYLEPLNMASPGNPPATDARPKQLPPDPNTDQQAFGEQLLVLAREAAARVVRRETKALTTAAKRAGSDAGAWQEAVWSFYGEHLAFVVSALHIPETTAAAYVSQQVAALLEHGAAAMTDWETIRVADLVALAVPKQGVLA